MKFYRVHEWLQLALTVNREEKVINAFNPRTEESYTMTFDDFYIGVLYHILAGDFNAEAVETKCIMLLITIAPMVARETKLQYRKLVAHEVVEHGWEEPSEEDFDKVKKAIAMVRFNFRG